MSSVAAVVLVNFRCADLVSERASEAIAAGHSVFVTDNSGEYDGPGHVIKPGKNLGFGVGCNRAVDEIIDQEWVCLANPDTLLNDPAYPDGVLNALTVAAQAAGLDVAAPTLRTDRGIIRRGYRFPQLQRELVFAAKTYRTHSARTHSPPASTPTARNRTAGGRTKSLTTRFVTGPRFGSGALLAVRLEAWHQVGGFDDRFVLYGEDLDFWRRLEQSGASVGFIDSIEIKHRQGFGSPTPRLDRDVLRWAGIQLFAQIHHGDSWRRYRRIHALTLSKLAAGGHLSPVAQLIHDAWESAADPIDTGARLRGAFDSGLMGRTSEPAVP